MWVWVKLRQSGQKMMRTCNMKHEGRVEESIPGPKILIISRAEVQRWTSTEIGLGTIPEAVVVSWGVRSSHSPSLFCTVESLGKGNIVALVFAEAAASRPGVGGGESPCFAPGGCPEMETDCFQMCQQSARPESLQCRQMPWAVFRMARPFIVLRLSSGAGPERQGNVPQPDSFPPKLLQICGPRREANLIKLLCCGPPFLGKG